MEIKNIVVAFIPATMRVIRYKHPKSLVIRVPGIKVVLGGQLCDEYLVSDKLSYKVPMKYNAGLEE